MKPESNRLSEIERRRRAYLEQIQDEINVVKRNKADLVKSQTSFYGAVSSGRNSRTNEGNVIERQRQAYLDLVEQETRMERRNKKLADYLKSKNQQKQFPDALNLNSNIDAVDVIQANTEDAEYDKARESELAFNNLKSVMNPAYARDLRDQLQARDDALTNPTDDKFIFMLNAYWTDIKTQILKRFRVGSAKPEIIYKFIIGYIEHIIRKFEPSSAMTPVAISFATNTQAPAPTQQPQPHVQQPQTVLPAPYVTPIPQSLLTLKLTINRDQIQDFIVYAFYDGNKVNFVNDYSNFYVNNINPTARKVKYTADDLLWYIDYLISIGQPMVNNGNMDLKNFQFFIDKINDRIRRVKLKHRPIAVSSSTPTASAAPPTPIAPPTPPFGPPTPVAPLIPATPATPAPAKTAAPATPTVTWAQVARTPPQAGVQATTTPQTKAPSKPKRKPSTGNGLKSSKPQKKKLKYIIKGNGSAKTSSSPKPAKPFFVDIDNLNRNVLSVRYRSSRKYKINPMVISDGEKVMINEIITHQRFNHTVYERLSNEEKRRVELLIHELKMDNELDGYDPFAATKDLYNQLQVIRGQIEAGNNNPALTAMAKKIIPELYALKRLTKTQANQILMELL